MRKVEKAFIAYYLILAMAIAVYSLVLIAEYRRPKNITNIAISDGKFIPDKVIINKGDEVSWTNHGGQHSFVENKGEFVSLWPGTSGGSSTTSRRRGQIYSRIFYKSGKYNYRCTKEPSMKGTIIVK